MTRTEKRFEDFIALLDEAVCDDCIEGRCNKVKQYLENSFKAGKEDWIEEEFLQPAEEKYARRLLHRDPEGRYSVVVMVWGVGQGTPLHDHAGEWCVECVYRGKVRITSYDLVGGCEDEIAQFERKEQIYAGVGEAGALIPPFEYHVIENALPDEPTVTVHVYGHELTWCNIFQPEDGGYRKVKRELSYND